MLLFIIYHYSINLHLILNMYNSSSCIDLIFNLQLNLLIESDVHPSLNPSCYHETIHKRGDKQILINYHPVSLFPICTKSFEKPLCNGMFDFFFDKGLISANQSGFKPGDSCINQLLSRTHNIYKPFDDGYEVRDVFLDISNAFEKIWHNGLIFKLQENEISSNLSKFLEHFLTNRK